MSQQYTKLTMHWYSSEVSLESCRHGYSWVKDNLQGDRLFISLLTDYRRYRAATLSTKRSVCNIRVLSPHSKWIRTDITHRQRGTDRLYVSKFVVQRSIDLALLLLTLLQGSSIEAVNPIKLCFLCLCQHSSRGNTQPRGYCPWQTQTDWVIWGWRNWSRRWGEEIDMFPCHWLVWSKIRVTWLKMT